MKKYLLAALAVLLTTAFVAGCKTQTVATPVSADSYVVCDDAGESGDKCDGANPEKGLASSACLADGRSITKIEEIQNNAILVTCGEKIETKEKR